MITTSRREFLQHTAIGAAALSAPSLVRAQSSERNLRLAVPTYPPHFDPVLTNITPALRTMYNVYDSLLRFDFNEQWALRPALAASWNRVGNRTLDFVLREDVRFHDGSTMTSDDVVFSFSETRTLGPEGDGGTVAAQYQGSIEAVTAIDERTVRITTRFPDPAIEQKIAAWSGQIVSRGAFEAAGSWEAWLDAPIGTGPYRIADFERDVSLVLEAHPDYWGGMPPFARIEYRVVPETASRISGLLAGEYDIAFDVLPDQIGQIEGAGAHQVVGGDIANVRVIAFDTLGPSFADPRIRRALSLSADRQALVKGLWGGRVSIPRGHQNPAFQEIYIEDQPHPEFDPEAARALLDEAGYDGAPLEYRLLSGYYPNQDTSAQLLQDMWRQAGINVELRTVESWGQVYEEPIDAMFDTSTLMAWPDPTGMLLRLYGEQGLFQARRPIWKPGEFNEVAAAFERSSDTEERRRHHRRMLEITQFEDPPFLLLHNNGVFYGKSADLAWAPYSSLITDFGPFNPATRA